MSLSTKENLSGRYWDISRHPRSGIDLGLGVLWEAWDSYGRSSSVLLLLCFTHCGQTSVLWFTWCHIANKSPQVSHIVTEDPRGKMTFRNSQTYRECYWLPLYGSCDHLWSLCLDSIHVETHHRNMASSASPHRWEGMLQRRGVSREGTLGKIYY